MNKKLTEMSINDLQKSVEEGGSRLDTITKRSTILMSKTIFFLSGEIASLKEAIHEDVENIVASNKKLIIANWAYSVAMLLVTTAIAYSALVQAGIISNFK